MTKQKIKKQISLNSTREKVWEVLTADKFTRQWYAIFREGTYAETDWQEGSKALFKDGSGSGLIGTIVASKPAELIDIEYHGMLDKGVEDYDGPIAQSMKGGHEIYRLTPANGQTTLAVELDMPEEYYAMMSNQWDEALVKIKELSEAAPITSASDVANRLYEIKTELLQTFAAFQEQDINRAPSEGSWTAAQVMEHLRIADGGVAKVVYAPAAKTSRRREEKAEILAQIFLNYDARYQAPDETRPAQKAYDKTELEKEISAILDKLITAAKTLDQDELVTVYELPKMGQMTRFEFLLFALYHTQRHTRQLKNIYNTIYKNNN
jgi:uncharacterized protein YndB with AHSA1/START domain